MTINNQKLFKLINKYNLHFLSKFFTFTDGYIHEEEKPEDFWMGANKLDKKILKELGDYIDEFNALDKELQNQYGLETMNCTVFSLLKILAIIAFVKWGVKWNLSERFTGIMSGTSPRGNVMTRVLDSVRKIDGVVPDVMLPWTNKIFRWAEYYISKNQIKQDIKNLGQTFLKEYTVGYERVPMNKSLIMSALKYSPLYVAGYAWYSQNKLYRSYGNANHAFVLLRALNDHYTAGDSYSPFIKDLAPDYLFAAIFLITLNKKEKEFDQKQINKLLNRGYKYIMRTEKSNGGNGEIYKLTSNGLKELTTQEKMEIGIKGLADKKDLTGISEINYYNLIK